MAEEKLKILYLMQILLEETDVMIHPHKESLFYATVTVTVSPQFFGWLAGIGKGIRISWPEDVREAYRQYLQKIMDTI
jgi:hypothetical protein